MRTCNLFVTMIALAPSLTAQAPMAIASVPPTALIADHPDLYGAFFMNGLQPAAAIRINFLDGTKFDSLSVTAVNDLKDLDRNLQTYLARVKVQGHPGNPATLQAYDASRAVVILRNLRRIRQSLSPQGWREFHDWVNGPFRLSLGGR